VAGILEVIDEDEVDTDLIHQPLDEYLGGATQVQGSLLGVRHLRDAPWVDEGGDLDAPDAGGDQGVDEA